MALSASSFSRSRAPCARWPPLWGVTGTSKGQACRSRAGPALRPLCRGRMRPVHRRASPLCGGRSSFGILTKFVDLAFFFELISATIRMTNHLATTLRHDIFRHSHTVGLSVFSGPLSHPFIWSPVLLGLRQISCHSPAMGLCHTRADITHGDPFILSPDLLGLRQISCTSLAMGLCHTRAG